jgi:hypothetical protein
MSIYSNFPGQSDSTESIQSTKPGKHMIEQWLRCAIFKGMFSDELAIKYLPSGSTYPVSVFVPKEMVQGDLDQGTGQVKVTVFRRGENPWVILPTSQRIEIPVKESDLASL